MFTFGTKQFPPIPENGPGMFTLNERASKTPLEMLCEFSACIIGAEDGKTMVAAINPTDSALRFFVQQHVGGKVTWYTASPTEITHVMRLAKLDHREKIDSLLHSTTIDESAISRIVSYTIQYAFSESASDIHFEPKKYHANVRFRVDGVLHKMFTIPSERYIATVARIKILANLRTDESRRPQDGRIEPEGYDGASLRVSIMPTLYGEKIVMRILDETNSVLEQTALGFSKEQINIIRQNIEKPYGMIVASGPTGSGKTTTLYSLLNLLSTNTVNIATLEDPIEYALDGVNQTQVHPELDFNFARGLRTLLRQDPDVILVGEIRDHETTTMAAQASMTGHLVLTSMHTNDAPSAFSRFIEMGIEEFMVVSTINLVIAQRLVRKLCPKCTKKELLPDVIQEKIKTRKDVCVTLESITQTSIKNLTKTKFSQPVGCDDCLGSGYSGRIGIFELLEMTPEIHDAVLSGKSAADIRRIAEANGFTSMLTDGIQKVFSGQTSFAEVLRTTRTN